MAGRNFSVCFICRGNRFRSPLAQAFVERLTLGLPVQVSSAGTLEAENAPALPEARQIAALCGVDLSGHRSQRLSALSLEAVDLVIGFEEAHARHAIVDAGALQANTLRFASSSASSKNALRRETPGRWSELGRLSHSPTICDAVILRRRRGTRVFRIPWVVPGRCKRRSRFKPGTCRSSSPRSLRDGGLGDLATGARQDQETPALAVAAAR